VPGFFRRGGFDRRGPTEPEGGWLARRAGIVELVGDPPDWQALHVVLDASRLLRGGTRPGPRLARWLAALHTVPLRWDDAATERLFAVLMDGDARSWRVLEATGVLARALPELAVALTRRRATPRRFEPDQVLRWETTERLRMLVTTDPTAQAEWELLAHPEWVMLAALVLDMAGDEPSRVPAARRLVLRLDLGAEAEQEIALIVDSPDLLRGVATRPDGLAEDPIVQTATHLHRPERARSLFLVTLASGALDPWERARVVETYRRVLAVLDTWALGGLDARNLVEQRRREAARLVPASFEVHDRVLHAPRAYVLSQSPADIARQSSLLEPVPAKGKVRILVEPLDDRWRIEVACRDRKGVLAAVTGVLAAHDLDVTDAVAATWPDGGALEAFVVRALTLPPDPAALEAAIAAALRGPLEAPALVDAETSFDDASSPWYTRCEVRGPDRPGLLHAITTAFASAGASVHSARVGADGDRVADRFELTDPSGRKLDDARKQVVRRALRTGVTAPRRRRFGFHRLAG